MAGKADKSNGKAESTELAEIKALYEVMVAEGLDVLELKDDDERILLNRQKRMASTPIPVSRGAVRHAGPTSGAAPTAAPSNESIKAPLAGVFYRAGAPTRPPFSKEGDVVDAGQTLCIIEAMKVMNEIKAEKRCRIVKITAENSRPVTVEQDLFWIEPA